MMKKDSGYAAVPWVLMIFFLAVFMFIYIFYQSMGMSAKYIVQDALASSALAGEVVNVDILSSQNEYLITDLSNTKDIFEDTLKSTLHLDDSFRPEKNSAYFQRDIPLRIEELTIYNVSRDRVYKTDLLRHNGILNYSDENGLSYEPKADCMGRLLKNKKIQPEEIKEEDYNFSVIMLDGEEKKIKGTSLYARIRLGVRSYGGDAAVVEKDILTDITGND